MRLPVFVVLGLLFATGRGLAELPAAFANTPVVDLGVQATEWGELHCYQRVHPLKVSAPRYPEETKRKGIEGTVVAEAFVNEKGIVTKVRVAQSSGDAGLDKAALTALMEWTYPMVSEAGAPSSYVVRQEFPFVLLR